MAWGKTVGVASWVERLKENDASLTSVTVFRGRLFGSDEAAAVCAALRSNTHLLELYASGHAMDAATAATLADALSVNKSLRSLCVGDDAFGDAGLAALAPGVARSASLQALDLENKGIGDAGAVALGAALATAKSGGCPSLTTINLSRNDALGPEGIAAVCAGAAHVSRLRKLVLNELRVGGVAADAIANLLASAPALAALDLSDAKLDVAAGDVAKLRAGLEARARRDDSPVALSLDMDGVQLGDEGAVGLIGGAEETSALVSFERVSLRGCGVGAAGGGAVARACAASTEILLLRDNRLGDAGARAVASALAGVDERFTGCSLRTLDLGRNDFGADGASLIFETASDVVDLSFFGNESIGSEGVASMLSIDSRRHSMRSLDIGGCGVDAVGLAAFCDALAGDAHRLPRLETLVVGGNPGTQSDDWEPALARLREARPGLDVAWRAADAGETTETKDTRANLLADAAGEGQTRDVPL
jgi:Ran GTPase-activating protein (RanGAP) involved in mRNA processing and transport